MSHLKPSTLPSLILSAFWSIGIFVLIAVYCIKEVSLVSVERHTHSQIIKISPQEAV